MRRFLLVIFLVAGPLLMTAAMYIGSLFLLHATNRIINPQVLYDAAAIEFPIFLFVAVLEVKNRW